MYPRNAASPERIAIGALVQISDGAVQTSGATITVRGQGGAEATGGGTTAYGATGVVYYTPTQAETDFTSFVVIASKTGCVPVCQTIVTSASATPGTVLLAPVTHTSAVVPTVTTLTNLPAITANWLTATGIASDAITAAKVADDVSTEFRTKALALTTCSGVVGSGSTTANVVASSVAVGATTSISADAWKGRVIIFNSDTTTAALRGQAGVIQSHTSGSTPTFTMLTAAWTTAPLSSDSFTVV